MRSRHLVIAALALFFVACGTAPASHAPTGPGGKGDNEVGGGDDGRSGWSSDNSYEVAAVISSQIVHQATGDYAALATDAELQRSLAETQIKYVRNTIKAYPWQYYLEQLAREITIDTDNIIVDGDTVTIPYTAAVDLVKKGNGSEPPALEDLQQKQFTAVVPLDPVDVYRTGYYQDRLGEDCADDYGDYILQEYKYYYYFAPEKEGCKERMEQLGIYHQAALEITEVYPVRTVYPEYDLLSSPLDDQGTVGFAAAILPNLGDDDPKSRFAGHKYELEHNLGLVGTSHDNGRYWRYVWEQGQARITVDLYDPTEIPYPFNFSSNFHQALGAYQLVQYNGHSNYGHKDLLANQQAFMDPYQIIVMHSCSSYAYYSQQVFRAKASDAEDATDDEKLGWATADVLATGKSSYPSDSPTVMGILLQGLMDGLVAIEGGTPADAPSWQAMTRKMNQQTWGNILYGVSGSRTNAWQPPQPE